MSSNVNVPVNLNGLSVSLQNGEEFTAKQFVQSFINELKVTVDEDFSFDSTGKIANNKFWRQLRSLTVNELLTLKVDQIHETARYVTNIFDITVDNENIFKCWHHINRFILDVLLKCTNEIFPLLGAVISAALLNKFIEIPDFDQNDDIMENIIICLKSGYVLADAVQQEEYAKFVLRKKTKISNKIFNESLDCINSFYDLFAKNRVFFNEIVFQDTLDFLKKSSFSFDDIGLPKYLAVLSTLRPDRIDLMYQLCTEAAKANFLIKLLKKFKAHRLEIMGILREVLEYARTNNVLFQADWITLFSFGMFSTVAGFKKTSKQLFLLEAERKDDGEMADDNTMVEKAIRIFCGKNNDAPNDANVEDFIVMFKEDIDFVTCEKLFHLLAEHVSKEQQKMAFGITLIIKGVVKMLTVMEPFNRNRYVRLIRNIFQHIELVRVNPKILYRLINTIDLNVMKNDDEFREEMLLIEVPVLRAFYECDNYGTAIQLLTILKTIDFNGDKLYKMICDLMEKNAAAKTEDKRKMLELTLAAAETFDIFTKLNPLNQLPIYLYFKGRFEASTNDIVLNALYVTLNVYILKAYRTCPPDASELEITREMKIISKYINEHVLEENNTSFSSMIFGIAFCVLNVDTAACSHVDDKALHEVTCKLADVSEDYHDPEISGTDEDDDDDDVKNFSLITTFWRCFNNLYRTRRLCAISPLPLLEYYFYADDKLIAYVEEFILIVVGMNVPQFRRRYGFFSSTVCDCVEDIQPVSSIMPLIRKLFRLIDKTTADTGFVAPDIAMEIFGLNIALIRQKAAREKITGDVQCYLYHMQFRNENLRETALNTLNAVIDGCNGDEKERLKKLLNNLTKAPMPPPRRDEPESDSDDSGQSHRTSNANSGVGGRRTSSLASVNQSLAANANSRVGGRRTSSLASVNQSLDLI